MRPAPAVALVTAAALLGDTLLYTVLPVSAARLGLDALAVGLALSLNRWVRLLTNVLAARLYERFAAGALIVLALALAVISTAAYALPAALVAFLGARLVWGFSWSLLRLGSLLAAIDTAGARAGRALGDMRALFGLGYLAGAIYATFAVETWGWAIASFSAAALTLALGLWPMLAASSWRRGVAHIADDIERASLWAPRLAGLFLVAAIQYALYSGLLAVAGGLRVAELFTEGGALLTVLVPATVIAGAFVLTQRISQVVWTPIAGRLADRSISVTFLASTLLATASIAGVAVTRDASLFVVFGGVAFFAGITSIVTVELAIAHRSTDADRPRVLAAYNTWADLGAAVGALGGGALALAGAGTAIALGVAAAAMTLPIWAAARGGTLHPARPMAPEVRRT